MKRIFLVIILQLNWYYLSAQSFVPIQNSNSGSFGQMLEGSINSSYSKQTHTNAVTFDRFDNCYSTSRFITSFSAIVNGASTNFSNVGVYDAYVIKKDVAGNTLWIQQFTSDDESYKVLSYDISADYFGDVYVVGTFTGGFSVPLDAGGTLSASGSLTNKPFGFLIKLNGNNGKALWVKVFDTSSSNANHTVHTVATNVNINSDKIYISGHYSNGNLLIPGVTTPVSAGSNWDIFVASYDYDGNFLNHSLGNGDNVDAPLNSAVDNDDNFFLIGEYYYDLSFGSQGISNTYTGDYNAYLAKFSPNLTPVWILGTGINGKTDRFYDVAIDLNNDIIVVGAISAGADVNPLGSSNTLTPKVTQPNLPLKSSFLGKYDQSGNFIDGFILANATNTNNEHYFTGVGILKDNSILVSGFDRNGDIDYNPYGASNVVIPPNSEVANSFIASYDLNGTSSVLNYLYIFYGGNVTGDEFRILDLETSSCNGFIGITGAYSVDAEMEPNASTINSKMLLDINSSTTGYSWTDNFVATYRDYCAPTLFSSRTSLPKSTKDSSIKNDNVESSLNQVKIYPNPSDRPTLVVEGLGLGVYDLTVVDLEGKTVMTEKFNSESPVVNVEQLKKGTYLITFNNGKERKSTIYIKQ